MSQENKPTTGIIKVIIVLVVILIGWNLYTGATIQEIGIPGIFTIKFGRSEKPTLLPTKSERVSIPEVKKYLMDKQSNRIIVVTHLDHNNYRIEESSSPWPWEGIATIEGNKLIGEAKFRNSLAFMKVVGFVRDDGSIVVKYKFITGSDGKPSSERVDNHIWYPFT